MTLLLGNHLRETQQSAEGVLEWPSVTNCSLAISTAHAFDGTHSFNVTATANLSATVSTGTGVYKVNGGFSPGDNILFAIKVYADAVHNVRAIYNWKDSSNGIISVSNVIVGATKAGEDVALSKNSGFLVPAGCASYELAIVFSNLTTGENIYFDMVMSGNDSYPTADAGLPQSVAGNVPVTLAGSASGDFSPFTYKWEVAPSYVGPFVALSNDTTLTPSFTSPVSATPLDIPINFTVTDYLGTTASSSTNVHVQAVTGALLEGNKLTYAQQSNEGILGWSNSTNGVASLETDWFSDGSKSLGITATAAGFAQVTTGVGVNKVLNIEPGKAHEVRLNVKSPVVRTFRVIVNWKKADGTASLPQTSQAIGNSVAGAEKLLTHPSLMAPADAVTAEVLIYIGNCAAGEKHEIDPIYFGRINQAPVVRAGVDLYAEPGGSVSPVATVTDDENNTPFTYLWEIDPSYTGPAITTTNGNTLTPTFSNLPASVYGYTIPVKLTITDSKGKIGTDSTVINVYPGPWVYRMMEDGSISRWAIYYCSPTTGEWVWPW